MTEEEARKKWCPMVKGWQGNEVTGFSYMQHCEASDCMMWRWDRKTTIPCPECGASGYVHDDICPLCDEKKRIPHPEPRGYCGLSGRPGVLP